MHQCCILSHLSLYLSSQLIVFPLPRPSLFSQAHLPSHWFFFFFFPPKHICTLYHFCCGFHSQNAFNVTSHFFSWWMPFYFIFLSDLSYLFLKPLNHRLSESYVLFKFFEGSIFLKYPTICVSFFQLCWYDLSRTFCVRLTSRCEQLCLGLVLFKNNLERISEVSWHRGQLQSENVASDCSCQVICVVLVLSGSGQPLPSQLWSPLPSSDRQATLIG